MILVVKLKVVMVDKLEVKLVLGVLALSEKITMVDLMG